MIVISLLRFSFVQAIELYGVGLSQHLCMQRPTSLRARPRLANKKHVALPAQHIKQVQPYQMRLTCTSKVQISIISCETTNGSIY